MMSRIEKIKSMLHSLGYTHDATVRFIVRRFEKVDSLHVSVRGKNDDKVKEMFDKFHVRHGVNIVGGNFPSSSGQLQIDRLIEFLEEYDEKFNLNWCEVDFKELIIKPAYL